MRLLLFLKPWLLTLLLIWELDISDTADPNNDGSSNSHNPLSQNHLDSSQNQQQCSLNQLDISKFVVLTKDEKSSSGFVEVDKTEYLLEKRDNIYRYRFKDCCKCSMLKYGDQIVWTHDFNKYGYYYPTQISITSEDIDIKIKNYILSYNLRNDKWILTSKICFETINRTFFTIVTLDNTSDTGFKENDEYEYDLINYPNGLVIFIFKVGAKCVEFRHGNNVIWNYDKDKHKGSFPKSIVYKPNEHTYIDLNPYYYVYDFDSTTNSWISNSNKSYIGCGYLDLSKHPKCFTIVTLDKTSGTGFKENDTNQYKVYSYFKGFYLYMFNFNVICQEFSYENVTVWKYNGTKYPRSISVNLSESLFYIEFGFETLIRKLVGSDLINYTFVEYKSYKLESDTNPLPITEVISQPDHNRTPIELDIRNENINYHFQFSKDEEEDLGVYVPNEKFLFNRLVESKTIWEANNENEYATKVILKGTKDYPKYLLILPVLGEFVLYYKENEYSDWDDITSDRISFLDLNIFGYDKFGFGIKKLDFIHYKKSTFKFMFGYKFSEGVRCAHIKHNDVSLWSHSDLPKDSYPMGLYYDLIKKNLYLLFEYSDKHLFVSLSGPKCELVKIATTTKSSSLAESITPVAQPKSFTPPAKDSEVDKSKNEGIISEDTVSNPPVSTQVVTHKIEKTKEVKITTTTPKKESDKSKPVVSTPPIEDSKLDGTTPTIIVTEDSKETKDNKDTIPTTIVTSQDTKSEITKFSPSSIITQPTPTSLPTSESQVSVPVKPPQARSDDSEKVDLSTVNSFLSKFKIATEDSTDENDSTKYNLIVTPTMITYKFKTNVRCTELKFEDKSLWKYDHEKHKGNPPSFIFAHTVVKTVYVVTAVSLFVCSLDAETWSGSEAKSLQLDIKGEKSTEDYLYSKDENSKSITFTAKDNVVFQEVIRSKGHLSCGSDHTFYEAKDPSQNAFKLVVETLSSDDQKLTLYLVNGRVISFTKTKGYSYSPKSWIHFGPLGMEIFTEGTDQPNDSSKYDIFSVSDIFDYVFKEGAKCCEVKLKDESIWKHEKDKPYPKSISYDRMENRFLFNFGLENVVYKKVDDKWKRNVSSLSTFDIKSRESTDRYIFSKNESTNIGTFTAKDGYGFSKVIQKKNFCDICGEDKVVWEADETNEHAVKVLIDGLGTLQSTQEVQVYLDNGDLLKYTKRGDTCRRKHWAILESNLHFALSKTTPEESFDQDPTSSPKLKSTKQPKLFATPNRKPVELDIKSTKTTDNLEFSKDEEEDLRTYSAKDGYCFNKVFEKKGTFDLRDNDKIVWEANNENEYATKVILKVTKDYPKYLLILFIDDNFMLYYKFKRDDAWKDITSWRLSFSDFKFFGTDNSDPKIKELGSSHYERTINKFSFGYKFKDSVKCALIKHKTVTLWKHTNEPNDPFPSGLYYALNTNILRLCFTGTAPYTLRTQIGVDIDKPEGNCYEIIKDESKKTYTFTAKDRYLFRIVKQGQEVIWDTMDLTNNVEKVFYEGVDQDKKKITIYMGNDKKLVFEKFSVNELWNETTSTISTITVTEDIKDSSVPSISTPVKESSVPSIETEESTDTTPTTPPDQLIVLDISKKDSCDEYYYSRNVSAQIETFTAKPGYKFKQVKNGEELKWEAENNEYHNEVHLVIDSQGKLSVTVCDAESSDQNVPITLKPREDSNLSSNTLKDDFKVVTLDPLDNTKTKENDITQYDFDDGDIMLTYKFKPNSKCVQLKHGNNVIWNYDHTNHKSHPKSLHLFKTVFFFILGLRDNEFLLYGLTSDNQLECESFEGVSGISESDIKIITKDGTSTKENDTTQYEFKNLEFGFEYKFKQNAECTEVKFKNETIWKYDDIKHETYPDCIFFMSGNALVFPRDVKPEDSTSTKSQSQSGKSNESKDIKDENLVELDIGSKKSTDHYEYSEDKRAMTHIYTPKDGYAFKKVFQKKRDGKVNDIWVPDDQNKYATKVDFNHNNKKVGITLDDKHTITRSAT